MSCFSVLTNQKPFHDLSKPDLCWRPAEPTLAAVEGNTALLPADHPPQSPYPLRALHDTHALQWEYLWESCSKVTSSFAGQRVQISSLFAAPVLGVRPAASAQYPFWVGFWSSQTKTLVRPLLPMQQRLPNLPQSGVLTLQVPCIATNGGKRDMPGYAGALGSMSQNKLPGPLQEPSLPIDGFMARGYPLGQQGDPGPVLQFFGGATQPTSPATRSQGNNAGAQHLMACRRGDRVVAEPAQPQCSCTKAASADGYRRSSIRFHSYLHPRKQILVESCCHSATVSS